MSCRLTSQADLRNLDFILTNRKPGAGLQKGPALCTDKLELVVKHEKKEDIKGSRSIYMAAPEHFIDDSFYSVSDF